MPDKTYSEAEYRKILKRAAELESERLKSGKPGSTEGGLTLDEIAEAASEAGIDPKLIYQAATESEERHSEKSAPKEASILDNDLYVERLIDVEANREMMDALVAELNHRYREADDEWYGGQPNIKRYGKSVEWSQTDSWEMYERRVLLQPVGKKLRIRVSKRLAWGDGWSTGNISMSVFLPMVLVGIIIFGAISDKVYDTYTIGIIATLILSAIALPAAKYYNKHSIKKHKREVETITDELVSQIDLLKEEEGFSRSSKAGSMQEIELPDEEESKNEDSAGLKNNLKEKN